MEIKKGRVLIGIPIMLFYIWIFYFSGPAWNSARGAAAIYSILAFLCVTLAVSLLNLHRIENSISNQILTGTAIFGFLIFAGSAISNIWHTDDTVVHTQPSGVFLNLVSLAFAGVLLLVYTYMADRPQQGDLYGLQKYLAWIIAAFGVLIAILFTVITWQPVLPQFFIIGGYITGALATSAYFSAGVYMIRKRKIISTVDTGRMSIAFWSLGIASFIHIYFLTNPSELWLLSMGFVAMGFIYATIGITVPYLLEIGVTLKRAFTFSMGITFLVLIPFLGIYILDNFATGTIFVDIGVTMVIHLSAALLAGGAAFVLYMRTKSATTPWHLPIILLFLFWTIAEVAVAISPLFPSYTNSETIVPYIAGSVVATLLLFIAYRNTFSPKRESTLVHSRSFLVVASILFLILLIISEFIRYLIPGIIHDPVQLNFIRSALASTFMLAFSFLSFFALLNLFFALMSLNAGESNIDANISSLSTLWVIVVIFRANFATWTTGWWMTEIMLYSVALVSILFILKRYVYEETRKSEFENRIAIQKQLLTSELLNKIHNVTGSIEALGRTSNIDTRLEILTKALSDVLRAESIAQKVNVLLSEERFSVDDLMPVDLIDICRVVLTSTPCNCTPSLEFTSETCLVLANDFLTDAIRNSIDFFVQRIGPIKLLEATFSCDCKNEQPHCVVHLKIEIETKNATEKQAMVLRYLNTDSREAVELIYAKRLISMFDGTIRIVPRAIDVNLLSVAMDIALLSVSDE